MKDKNLNYMKSVASDDFNWINLHLFSSTCDDDQN